MFFHTIEKTKYLSPAFLFLTSTHKTKCFFTNQTKQQKKELKTKNSDDTKKNQFNFFLQNCTIYFYVYAHWKLYRKCSHFIIIIFFLIKLSPIYLCNRRIHIYSAYGKFLFKQKHACLISLQTKNNNKKKNT